MVLHIHKQICLEKFFNLEHLAKPDESSGDIEKIVKGKCVCKPSICPSTHK